MVLAVVVAAVAVAVAAAAAVVVAAVADVVVAVAVADGVVPASSGNSKDTKEQIQDVHKRSTNKNCLYQWLQKKTLLFIC